MMAFITALISITMAIHRRGSIVSHRCQSCTVGQALVLLDRRTEGARTMGDGASIETETGLDSSVIAEMKEGDRPTVSTGVAAAMIGRVAEATVEADQGAETENATDGGADRQGDLNRRIKGGFRGRLTLRRM